LLVNAANVRAAVDFALEQQLDFLLLDPTNALPGLAGELAGAPDISILNRAVRRLRELDREEEVDLVYFGGLRTGTDSAKMLALGTIAVTVGASMALALGADISSGDAVYSANLDAAEREQRSSNLLQAFTAEASMMARCTGKTNVQNLEPEDLRAITLVVSHAAGVPMAGSLHQH
jgi:glutamate synthase domain-containing protein 2